jgi:hypothetical protein
MVLSFDYVKIMIENIKGFIKYVKNEMKKNLKMEEVISGKRWRNMFDLEILMRNGNILDYYDTIMEREYDEKKKLNEFLLQV